jgi:hypothetical protein
LVSILVLQHLISLVLKMMTLTSVGWLVEENNK